MKTASCGWQYCKLTCYCICRPWHVVDVMEHERMNNNNNNNSSSSSNNNNNNIFK
jgi:hypothetical protein